MLYLCGLNTNQFLRMKPLTFILLLLTLLLPTTADAQQRDRLAELNVACLNEFLTYTSVAPDGSLWMATMCGEIFRADDIHSPWITLKKESHGRDEIDETFENIVAFDRNTAIIVGNMWGDYFKRTTNRGKTWSKVKYDSKRWEWFHPVWRGQNGEMWTGSQKGYLTFSNDYGRTFHTLQNDAFDDQTDIREIYMLSSDSGWIAAGADKLYSTSNNWHTVHRWSTPNHKGVSRVRPWKNYLLVTQSQKSYYTMLDGNGQWQRTPLALSDFEVDTLTGKLWAIDDDGEILLMEDIDQWKPMGKTAMFIIGIHDGFLYCRVDGGVMRVNADGVVDHCPLLTAESHLKKPKNILSHGNYRWGYDENSVYLHDAKRWYRVARPLNIASMTPDPDRKDRVIILNQWGENLSIDIDGRTEPYIYSQPLAAFVKPGLKSMEITTYSTLGWNIHQETISFLRSGDSLIENARTETRASYDPRIGTNTSPIAANDGTRHLLTASLEKALLALGECYSVFPTPQDFGLDDTLLDLNEVYAEREEYSTNKYGYAITFINQANETLTVEGQTSAHVDLGGSTHYPWLLPMVARWREAEFMTYQPVLWQALREAMPNSMQLREYLDNSTLHPRHTLQSGDLIFCKGWSEMDKAITASTGEYTHVALVERDSADNAWIIEALPEKGVLRRSFREFERRFSMLSTFDVYRLTQPFDTAAVIARAKSLVGKPYDEAFLPENDAYYCSELIEVVFDGLFPSKPMNWRDAKGNLPAYWKKHFEKLGVPVPEGVPGTNPTDMSRSPILKKL